MGHDRLPLVSRADEAIGLEGQALVDRRLEPLLHACCRLGSTLDYHVPGLEQGSHMIEPESGEDLAEVVHPDTLVPAEIDAAEQCDARTQGTLTSLSADGP